MDMDSPKISVIMPVYQGDAHLSAAIQSILDQTYSDFEFLILCDEPSDTTRIILDTYQHNDSRIRVYYQQNRLGLIGSLNYGISMARGEYIARMDADDISSPDRFYEQIVWMDSHPDIGICGTWVLVKDKEQENICRYPVDDITIQCEMLFTPPIAHPTVFIRRKCIEDNEISYNEDNKFAEDFGFWVKASSFTHFSNIPKALLMYRVHDGAVSQSYKEKQLASADEIRKEQLKTLGIIPTAEELFLHRQISMWNFVDSQNFLERTEKWLTKLITANATKSIYPEPNFSTTIEHRWYSACCIATGFGIWTWKRYCTSKLRRLYRITNWQWIRFFSACAIRYKS